MIPLGVIVVAVAAPLWRHVEKGRGEQAAIDAVLKVREAQDRFQRRTGGYATELSSLTRGCNGVQELSEEVLLGLSRAGYGLRLRASEGAAIAAQDCLGHPLSDDYYVAAAPVDASRPGQQAFSARSRGELFLFYDGIAPRESEIDSGLATPLAKRETFKIP